jgi:hypothetical protein
MEEPKRKNDQAPAPLTVLIRHSIWSLLALSYLYLDSQSLLSFLPGASDFRSRGCYPMWHRQYLLEDHIFVNLALVMLWYVADHLFKHARVWQLIRLLIVVYLFAGRWVLAQMNVAYAC